MDFHGTVDADDLAQTGVESEDETPQASAMAVILNDRLVKVALNVLEGGEFPYDILAWQRRPGYAVGHRSRPQDSHGSENLNGGVRAMMDNAGLSAGVQIVLGNGLHQQTVITRYPVANCGVQIRTLRMFAKLSMPSFRRPCRRNSWQSSSGP